MDDTLTPVPADTDTTPRPWNAITHTCGGWWTGLGRSHCPACCRTFSTDGAAHKHRVGKPGIDRRCVDPATVGLIAVEQPWGLCWQAPGTDTRFTASTDAEAA